MKSFALQLSKKLPRKVRRHPLVRDIHCLQYSEEMDVDKRYRDLQSVFPALHTGDETIAYEKTYILAMSARVGSTALVQWLQIAGLSHFQIREIFNNRGPLAINVEKWGSSSLSNYLNNYSKKSGENRLPLKINWWDLAPLLKMINGDLETWFPNASWVYLEREDKVAQAYSLWKASMSGVWHQRQGDSSAAVLIERGEIPLDKIRERIMLLELENDRWKRFFDAYKITPTCVVYEDFLANPKEVMTTAYKAFTGEAPKEDTVCPMVRLSSERDRQNVDYLKSKLSTA